MSVYRTRFCSVLGFSVLIGVFLVLVGKKLGMKLMKHWMCFWICEGCIDMCESWCTHSNFGFLFDCIEKTVGFDVSGDDQFLALAVERYLDKFLELKRRHPKVTC